MFQHRTKSSKSRSPSATTAKVDVTIPGFSGPVTFHFPKNCLPAACPTCKKNFKSKEICRLQHGHTDLPWTCMHLCVGISDSCFDSTTGKLYQSGHFGCDFLIHQLPVCEERILPGMKICTGCKESNYTKSYCREKKAHRKLQWTTVYFSLERRVADGDVKIMAPIREIPTSRTFFLEISAESIEMRWLETDADQANCPLRLARYADQIQKNNVDRPTEDVLPHARPSSGPCPLVPTFGPHYHPHPHLNGPPLPHPHPHPHPHPPPRAYGQGARLRQPRPSGGYQMVNEHQNATCTDEISELKDTVISHGKAIARQMEQIENLRKENAACRQKIGSQNDLIYHQAKRIAEMEKREREYERSLSLRQSTTPPPPSHAQRPIKAEPKCEDTVDLTHDDDVNSMSEDQRSTKRMRPDAVQSAHHSSIPTIDIPSTKHMQSFSYGLGPQPDSPYY